MKKIAGRISLFLKKSYLLFRIIPMIFIGYVVFELAIPDIKFNLTTRKAIEMTFEELMNTPSDEIPLYLKIKDAVVPSDSYVEFRDSESNSLNSIYYPVYAIKDVKLNITTFKNITKYGEIKVVSDSSGNLSALKNTNNINSKLVIYDPYVKESELDSTGGTYFNNPNFTIEGEYSKDKISAEVLNLLTESGLNVSPDAIVLKKGFTPAQTSNALLVVIIGSIILILGITSFLPESTLKSWL